MKYNKIETEVFSSIIEHLKTTLSLDQIDPVVCCLLRHDQGQDFFTNAEQSLQDEVSAFFGKQGDPWYARSSGASYIYWVRFDNFSITLARLGGKKITRAIAVVYGIFHALKEKIAERSDYFYDTLLLHVAEWVEKHDRKNRHTLRIAQMVFKPELFA